jgi:hypothetical protein
LHLSLGQTPSDVTASGLTIRPDRSIHDPQFIAFIGNILDAGDLVTNLNLLSHGLAFVWITGPPTAYAEPNKKSAMRLIAELHSTVAAWESGGFVQLLSMHSPELIP